MALKRRSYSSRADTGNAIGRCTMRPPIDRRTRSIWTLHGLTDTTTRMRWQVTVVIGIVSAALNPHVCTADTQRQHDLMPLPAQCSFAEGRLVIDERFNVRLNTHKNERLTRAVERLISRLQTISGIPCRARTAQETAPATLEIDCQESSSSIPELGENESYSLEVGPGGARLTATTSLGVIRGLATIAQLVELDTEGYFIPAVTIQDRPRFPWRGLLIDVCRHWQPPEVIKRNLDGMEAVKLNVLHLHLSDDQAFRMESKRFPKLHAHGSDGHFLSQPDIRDIVHYAADRGIRVVPEFDVPGHSTSWLVGYPNLAAKEGRYSLGDHWGVYEACLDPTREEVYEFLDGFFGEVAELFPDRFLHIGGDEINFNWWINNPAIQSFIAANGIADVHALQAYFNRRLADILRSHDRRMIGWDEILNGELPTKCVVQSWQGRDTMVKATAAGHAVILSAGYYLDHIKPAAFHYLNDPSIAKNESTQNDPGRILGGEACMWSELVSAETIDSRIWPRMAAIAERLWSPANVNDVDDMYRRLERVSLRLDGLGLTHRSNYEPMLQRLTGGSPIDRLKTLVDVLEPVKDYRRTATRAYTATTPLNRVVDAARPESTEARRFLQSVRRFIDEGRSEQIRIELRNKLTRWRNNHTQLLPTIRSSALLAEVEPASASLTELAKLGLEALDLLGEKQTPPAGWSQRAAKVIEQSAHPNTEVEIAIVPAIRALVEATSTTASE